MTPRTVDVLRAARALISDRRRWTRWELARDKHGHACDPDTERAVRWCAIGAIVSQYAGEIGTYALNDAARNRGYHDAISLNDHHTHAEVLAMFDEAIRREEGR